MAFTRSGLIAVALGAILIVFAGLQDHKRVDDNAPTSLITSAHREAIRRLESLASGESSANGQDSSVHALRSQLLTLQSNLEGELSSVRNLLAKLDQDAQTSTTATAAPSVPTTAAGKSSDDSFSIDPAFAKKTMQQGAMKGESVEVQLRKVLDHDLKTLIQHKTSWKNAEDLDAAIRFADYLKEHPLRPNQEAAKEGPSTDGNSLVQAVDTVPNYYTSAAKIDQPSDESDDLVKQAAPMSSGNDAAVVTRPQAERSSQRGELGYVVQPGDRAIQLADAKGRRWAEDEILREHDEYVHLPSGASFPLAVKPYWG